MKRLTKAQIKEKKRRELKTEKALKEALKKENEREKEFVYKMERLLRYYEDMIKIYNKKIKALKIILSN